MTAPHASLPVHEAANALELGRQQAARGDFQGARRSFEFATRCAPASFDAWFLLGITYMRDERRLEALPALRQAHRLQPDQLDAMRALADAEFHAGLPGDALPLWQSVVAARPADVDARLKLGETLNRLGLLDREIANYQDALGSLPESADIWMALAQAREDGGDRTGAAEAYGQAMRFRPGWITPLGGLLSLQRKAPPAELVEQALALQARPDLPDRDRALLGYALGKIQDSRSLHAAAMASWHDANAARRRTSGEYDRSQAETSIQRLMHVFDAAFFARQTAAIGNLDERPVFVVGMPRSGTTLTEQIVAMHSQAHGCGELPDIALLVKAMGNRWPDNAAELGREFLEQESARYLAAASRHAPANALRLVDKSPLNYFNLGLIALLFPRARVVWCRRDPRDIALSIYSENFSLDAPFATDLDAIAHSIALQTRLMRHWQSTLPLPIHELQYEALVESPEPQAKALIAFLGLPWESACLEFHRSNRAVQTPSRWQVREPIHGRSAGRWRPYAGELPDFDPESFPDRRADRSS
jgi:cytochrome c-type biogenesis protein CcmH/NrfG